MVYYDFLAPHVAFRINPYLIPAHRTLAQHTVVINYFLYREGDSYLFFNPRGGVFSFSVIVQESRAAIKLSSTRKADEMPAFLS